MYKPGKIRNVQIKNFTCETQGRILITPDEGELLEDVVLENIYIRYPLIEQPNLSHYMPEVAILLRCMKRIK